MPDLRVVESRGEAPGKKAKPRGPRRSKAERAAIKSAKLALMADAQVDADLSRAVDAIIFLSQNEVDAAPLIARISPMEAREVSANLRKAVDWLNRFADGWHVFIGNIETQGASTGTGIEAGRGGGIRLVSCRD
jgi:hypothetical protein